MRAEEQTLFLFPIDSSYFGVFSVSQRQPHRQTGRRWCEEDVCGPRAGFATECMHSSAARGPSSSEDVTWPMNANRWTDGCSVFNWRTIVCWSMDVGLLRAKMFFFFCLLKTLRWLMDDSVHRLEIGWLIHEISAFCVENSSRLMDNSVNS